MITNSETFRTFYHTGLTYFRRYMVNIFALIVLNYENKIYAYHLLPPAPSIAQHPPKRSYSSHFFSFVENVDVWSFECGEFKHMEGCEKRTDQDENLIRTCYSYGDLSNNGSETWDTSRAGTTSLENGCLFVGLLVASRLIGF